MTYELSGLSVRGTFIRRFRTVCALLVALLIPVVGLRGADEDDRDAYERAMARADEAGTLILFVYSKDSGHNLSDQATGILLAQGRGSPTAGMVVQYIPISESDQRYAQYRSRIKGESYPFWVLAKPNGEFLAGGDYDTVVDDDSGSDEDGDDEADSAGSGGSGGWDRTVAELARQFPPIGPRDRERIVKTLARAQADFDAERLGEVKSSLGKLERVWYPSELAEQCAALRNAYDGRLCELRERPEQLVGEGKWVEACLAYQRLIDAFGGRDEAARAAREAQRELLAAHPEIRDVFTERLAQQRAEAAGQLRALPDALPMPDASEDQAGEQAGEDNLTTAQRAGDEALERSAASLVKIAQQYHGQGMVDQANARLTECIEKYPDTSAAEQARELLRKWRADP